VGRGQDKRVLLLVAMLAVAMISLLAAWLTANVEISSFALRLALVTVGVLAAYLVLAAIFYLALGGFDGERGISSSAHPLLWLVLIAAVIAGLSVLIAADFVPRMLRG
jgi:hypothetical protein